MKVEVSQAKSETDLNGEIEFVLDQICQLEEPPLFDDLDWRSLKSCLVDHPEEEQTVKCSREDEDRRKRIIGMIDHHALADAALGLHVVYHWTLACAE